MKQTNTKQNYKPKLFIDTQEIKEEVLIENFYNEVKDYSITPTTFKDRKFFKSPDEPIFIEEYTFKENFVTRFGINIHNEEFRKTLNQELVVHNENLNTEILEQSEKITNISGKTNYEIFSRHIQLTKCENFVLDSVIEYMKKENQKVALVDTFKREFSQDKNTKEPAGRIDLTETKFDTHTVLLYKTENKILAIDPNNPMFSTHLSKYKGIDTLCSTDEKYKIYSRPNNKDTGFASDKYRDCIDIAVKLGLLLNQEKTLYKTIEDIINSQVIKLIANNPLLDGMKFKTEELIRKKQSSDIQKVISANEEMKKISNGITEENLKYENEIKILEEKHLFALNELTQIKVELIGKAQGEYFNECFSDDI